MDKQPKQLTKFGKILEQRNMSYRDFQSLLFQKTGYYIGFDRISKLALGKQSDIKISTASKIAKALDVSINEISEF